MDVLSVKSAALGVAAGLLLTIRTRKQRRARTRSAMKAAARPHVLVTGGAGYIGSHTVLELVNAGYDVTVVDNLANSSEEALRRVGELTGRPEAIAFVNVDLLDRGALRKVFADNAAAAAGGGADPAARAVGRFESCIHFAGLKSVGESTREPLRYYHNNITGTLVLLELMREFGVRKIVFSSSATVYGDAPSPLDEASTVGLGITNPYGQTKFMLERVLMDLARAERAWGVVLLRYFNPIGAHPSGRIGEDPCGIPNNLMPYVLQVAVGRREKLTVFGGDYDTRDGTGERDYIHVVDLARGHLAALGKLQGTGGGGAAAADGGDGDDGGDGSESGTGCFVYNLGTGKPTSVLEMVAATRKASGKPVPYVVGARRPGDVPVCYALPTRAQRELGWVASKTIDDCVADGWRWQQGNPKGYGGAGEDC